MPDVPFDLPIVPMEAKVRTTWPTDGWAFEPKWDGFRAIASHDGEARIDSRKQKPLLRYFPELVAVVGSLPAGCVVDGEVLVVEQDRLAFDMLQARIHPAASRIEKLSNEIPATMIAFDLVADRGEDLRSAPFAERRERLTVLMRDIDDAWRLTPSTTEVVRAKRWFEEFEAAGCDGIVAKALGGPYVEGKREMIKIKHRRSVDCVVGGYRIHKDGDKIGSLLLGLYAQSGSLAFIGHCSGFTNHDRFELLERFDALRDTASFGPDVRTPGGESRWSSGKDLSWVSVKPGVVIEISYDQLTGDRFRHATRFERWRPDKDPADCTFDQLEHPEGPGFGEVVRAV
ncbi:MAG: ATP-dependent DNA ligase [Actinobacteria bacterium]|nr:MAG: ATP-dependent DNA ligase [Actinomycetota bacterium]